MRDILLALLKRIIVQLSLIIVSLVLFIYLFYANIDIDLRNQLYSISTGILTGAILSLIYIVIEKRFDDMRSHEELAKIARKIDESHDDLSKIIGNIGYGKDCSYCAQAIRCFSNRDDIKLGEKFAKAEERIWIFVTDLHYLLDSMTNIKEAAAKNKDLDVRILVLKPTSMFVKIRYKELDYDSPIEFFDELKVSIRDARKLKKKLCTENPACKFDIRTHLHTPSFMLFIIDDALYFNPIIPFCRARNNVHIYYNLKDKFAGMMAQDYINTFKICWDTSSDVEANYTYNENGLEYFDS